MLDLAQSHSFLTPEIVNQPFTVSWRLEEDMRLLGQRQGSLLLMAQQAATASSQFQLFLPTHATPRKSYDVSAEGLSGHQANSGFVSPLRDTELEQSLPLQQAHFLSRKETLLHLSRLLTAKTTLRNEQRWSCIFGLPNKYVLGYPGPMVDCFSQQYFHPFVCSIGLNRIQYMSGNMHGSNNTKKK